MKFASVKQIVAMVVLTIVGLFALDYYKNPQLWHRQTAGMAASDNKPRLLLWMNHMCCTGCLDGIRQALDGLPGIDLAGATSPKSMLTQAEANAQGATLPDYGNAIVLPITDLETVDLVAIDRALRDKGFVAGRMELSGVEHFRLEAALNHLCCGMCDRSIPERLGFLKAKGSSGQFRWLDSVSVDHDKKTVVASARFLEPGKSADVAEFLSGLNYLGFEPSALRVRVGEKMQHGMEHMN